MKSALKQQHNAKKTHSIAKPQLKKSSLQLRRSIAGSRKHHTRSISTTPVSSTQQHRTSNTSTSSNSSTRLITSPKQHFIKSLSSTLTTPATLLTTSSRSFAINLSTVKSAATPAPEQVDATPAAAAATPATPAARPRPQLKAPLSITPAAAERVLEICGGQDPPAKGIRLGVRTRGCSGLSYTMNFADTPGRLEEQVPIPNSDVRIFIENKALLYVIGTTMDWTETDVATEFTFNNPNSKGSCGCGESFTV